MGSWFRVGPAQVGTRTAVFLLPHAGGAASFFGSWAGRRGALELIPTQYPGREDRFSERALDQIDALAAGFIGALTPFLGGPFALFGHSMGGMLAYEVARTLRRRGLLA